MLLPNGIHTFSFARQELGGTETENEEWLKNTVQWLY